jgi:hypothetical protein
MCACKCGMCQSVRGIHGSWAKNFGVYPELKQVKYPIYKNKHEILLPASVDEGMRLRHPCQLKDLYRIGRLFKSSRAEQRKLRRKSLRDTSDMFVN